MATYLATVQIGRYELEPEVDGHGPDVRRAARGPAAGRTHAAFGRPARDDRRLRRLFGPYPFDAYTVVVTDDDLEIPLEAQGLSTFGANYLDAGLGRGAARRPRAGPPVVRQQPDRSRAGSDIWLHEGFACYAEWLWSESRAVADGAGARRRGTTHAGSATSPGPRARRPRARTDVRRPGLQARRADPARPAAAPSATTRSSRLLRAWVDTHRFGVVTTADFEALVRDETGVDTDALLGPWLRERGLPPLVAAPAAAR